MIAGDQNLAPRENKVKQISKAIWKKPPLSTASKNGVITGKQCDFRTKNVVNLQVVMSFLCPTHTNSIAKRSENSKNDGGDYVTEYDPDFSLPCPVPVSPLFSRKWYKKFLK